MEPSVLTFDTPLLAAQACGRRIFQLIEEALLTRPLAFIAVSGGSTPAMMFDYMAERVFDWTRVHLFWVDERCVPPDDVQSNFRMTREKLLDRIALAPDRIHRIAGELPPEEAARLYAAEVTRLVPGSVFDVIHRGMGADGHTASLFPGDPHILDRTGTVAALWSEPMRQNRVTLLPRVLEGARQTVCLATGADKAAPLSRVLKGAYDPLQTPAQVASRSAEWFIDTAAASQL